jgi:endonuclease/exonuclease/phosphatase family metal-dependent hydrolase
MRRLPPAARTFVPVASILLAATLPATLPVSASAHDSSRTTASKASKVATPDRITSATGVRGPRPGETTIRWKTSGGHTDYYTITTALTPFGGRHKPRQGRHSTTFIAYGGSRRSYTLSGTQTAKAGAGLHTGRRLFFRIKAVNKRGSSSSSRKFKHLRHATITGQSSRMAGAQLRFAEFNVKVQASDVAGHRWKDRQRLVARAIANARPAVAGIQELMPGMWNRHDGGLGLKRSLRRTGVGDYHLTRKTAYFSHAPQDTRILYNAARVRMTSNCTQRSPSCYIAIPGDGKREVAAYARFQDRATGQAFLFVSAHLAHGNDARTDRLRGRQAAAIVAGVRRINGSHLPVVLSMDANSSQTSRGADAAHVKLLNAGWYNTIAAARTEGAGYNSVNDFHFPQRPSPYGFGSMYDSIMTLHMPGADLWKQVIGGAPGASDHNLVYADIKLPR